MTTDHQHTINEAISEVDAAAGDTTYANLVETKLAETDRLTVEMELQRVMVHACDRLRLALVNEAIAAAKRDPEVGLKHLRLAAIEMFTDDMELDVWLTQIFERVGQLGYGNHNATAQLDAAIDQVHREQTAAAQSWRIDDAVNAERIPDVDVSDLVRDTAARLMDALHDALRNAATLATVERSSRSMNHDDIVTGTTVFRDQSIEEYLCDVIEQVEPEGAEVSHS